ncbi:class I SAM-dependent methyltransferase [Caballeronia sp. GAWG1-1]|uniref:rhamnosyltransferase WsaF family glycosyltransferase n=1 Tax=Caballeronia sp. GAWG1-1 TaxID=2921742 RepID=UPI002027CEA2|nr:class I SAM-dependent methyltransferase [Caballeronia sp. GAWG1-1]
MHTNLMPASVAGGSDFRDAVDAIIDPKLAPLFWRADRIDARSAWCGHIPFAHWLIGATRPSTLVELGTHAGVSYAAFCQSVERHGLTTRCYAVDTWAGDAHAGNYGERIFAELSQYHRARFSTFSTLLRMTFDEASAHFADGGIDLLHIDGLHTYEAVRHDFETWKPRLSERAVVLFHDTNERHDDFGVWKLWAELRDEYPSFEFVHGHGLAVLLVGQSQPESLRRLAELNSEDAFAVKQRFSLLGERWEAEQQLLQQHQGALEYLQATSERHQQQLAQVRSEHEAAIRTLRERSAAAAQSAHDSNADRPDLDLAVERLTAQLIEAQRRTREAERTLWLTRQDADARASAQDAQASAQSNAQVSAHAHAIALLRDEVALLDGTRASLIDERNAERSLRMQIEGSSFWRAGRPLRVFFTRHARLRRLLRTSARLMVWTASGKLGRQFAARRATMANAAVIAQSPFFDANWYVQQYDDARHSGLAPAVHYAIVGVHDLRNPGPLFDAKWYAANCHGLSGTGLNPLVHFERYGRGQGQGTQPVSAGAAPVAFQAAPVPAMAVVIATPIPLAKDLIEQRFSSLLPLNVYPERGTQKRVTMVTDSISAGSLFGGVGTAIVFSTLLAKRFATSLRLVTRTEAPDPSAFGTILKLNNIEWDGNIEFIFSPSSDGYGVPVGENELYVTTSWWTTRAVRQVCKPSQIVYLLQEDERMFYPHGDDRLRCIETISDPDISVVVNSEILFDHLTKGPEPLPNLRSNGTCFEPSFPFLAGRSAKVMVEDPQEKRRFFFYARPNNLRNLYWRGLEVLIDCLNDGTLSADEWEFHFVGKDMPDAALPHGIRPFLHRNLPWRDYLDLVSDMDIGLSLMDTPHPSYPPFDLAATGAIVVTNQHGCKRSLHKYSDNIICVEPGVESLKEGVRRAVALAGDKARRQSNAASNAIPFDWSNSLSTVFAALGDRLKKSDHV